VVKLRLKRMGRRHRPFYRINAMEIRNPRDGRVLEELGFFDPLVLDQTKQVKLDAERAKFWLAKGAVPTETVRNLLIKQGIALEKSK
jgi:small subunit ribosomal protein S16